MNDDDDCTCTNSQVFQLSDYEDADVDSAATSTRTIPQSAAATKRKQQPETENTKDTTSANSFWSIDDDTFYYPLGLLAHGNSAGKCVFVTWGSYYMLNFVFKVSTRTNRPKMTKVRLTIDADDEIADMLITELNTLLLMRSGRVYYFSSVKSIHPVNWLCQVRCISSAHAGFSLIRLHDNKLSLEIYRDVLCVGKSASTLLQSYDITFDTNLFNCPWQDERFTLHSQAIMADRHVHFMEQVIGNACQLHMEQEVHFFTVSGHVFALIADNEVNEEVTKQTNFHIQLLCSYASDVSFIRILMEQRICLVFLECGSIDMWYMSCQTSRLRRKTHHTGTEYTHYHYSSDTNCFYYTNEQQVAQLHFIYDAGKDTCYVRECIKSLPGILAVTWAPSLRQLVCLSCNNIFYRLTFDDDENVSSTSNEHCVEFENLNILYELTPARLTQLLHKAHILHELTQAPLHLHEAIEQQFIKRQLISVAHKTHYYTHLCKANFEYSMQLPVTHPTNTLLLYTESNWNLHSNIVYALIRLSICSNDMLCATNWQLHIVQSNGVTHLFQIPPDELHVPLCVVVPLSFDECEKLPEFQLKLLTLLSNANNEEHFIIALPIELNTTAQTYAQLLSPTQRRLCSRYAQHNVHSVIMHFNRKIDKAVTAKTFSSVDKRTIKYMLRLKGDCNFERIAKIFQVPKNMLNDDCTEFPLHFITSTLQLNCVSIEQQNYLQLQSENPLALYYTKLHLSKCLVGTIVNEQTNKTPLSKSVQQYQSFVQRAYSMLLQEFKEQLPHNQHLQDLQRIYAKLRAGCTATVQN